MATKKTAPPPAKDDPTGASDPPRTLDLSDPRDLIELIEQSNTDQLRAALGKHLRDLVNQHGLENYNVLVLHDDVDPISNYHANRIYQAASSAPNRRDILLIILSSGGSIEPAYLISKTCKRLAAERFVAAVPRRAKSAATLICLGADEIHMGLMSELGPIDPQIGGYPALALKNALNTIADLACQYPKSAEMFARYLSRKLDLKDVGYFERLSESAAQYAERLLAGKPIPADETPQRLSDHFVNHYKEHGFVIDVDEARSLLGDVIRQDPAEYRLSNDVYQFLNMFGTLLTVFKKQSFDYVGSIGGGLMTRRQPQS